MTDAKSANWYSDGENAARSIEDLFPNCVAFDTAGDAAEVFETGGREAFLFPIFSRICEGRDHRPEGWVAETVS